MTRDEGCRVRCPLCGAFLSRVTSIDAEFEMNCPSSRCRATLLIRREKGDVTVNVASKVKQA